MPTYTVPRKRTQYVKPVYAHVGAKRSVEKICRVISGSTSTLDQTSAELYTASDSNINRTLVGLKLEGAIRFASTGTFGYAIVRVPQGQTAGQMSVASGTDLYPTEEHVLLSGIVPGDVDDYFPIHLESKAMRKMKVGDKIVILFRASVTGGPAQMAFSYTMFLKDA